ncbi:type II toxin-antitoxin system RelE/ParE family toxin [Methylobacterium sp. 37f]|uniref:type II toxin-antitoxin system RelE/ParE family toxin n=1 Tax=Methylobacterium sp. 37f TaxID=2817058 RepID=UPI001FFCEB30|nr:type II toxin-antitoxin system RelE/ParE family toxin [Methylobacterium sp. 37f]
MGEYRLTQRADDDLLDLFVFGLQNFGDVQAQRYRTGLDRCFRLLADNPGLGRPAHRLAEGVRRHEFESHVILYEEIPDGVLILALVHGRSVRGLAL